MLIEWEYMWYTIPKVQEDTVKNTSLTPASSFQVSATQLHSRVVTTATSSPGNLLETVYTYTTPNRNIIYALPHLSSTFWFYN